MLYTHHRWIPARRKYEKFTFYFLIKAKIAANVKTTYVPVAVTANHEQFWFRGFRSGNFSGKHALLSGRPIATNIDKILKVLKYGRHISTVSIAIGNYSFTLGNNPCRYLIK